MSASTDLPAQAGRPSEALSDAITVAGTNNVTAWLDNDNVSFVDAEGEPLLEMHPADLLHQVLTYLGFTVEQV